MLFLDREGKHPVGDINCSVFLEQMNNCEMFLVAVYVYEEMRTIFLALNKFRMPSIAKYCLFLGELLAFSSKRSRKEIIKAVTCLQKG